MLVLCKTLSSLFVDHTKFVFTEDFEKLIGMASTIIRYNSVNVDLDC